MLFELKRHSSAKSTLPSAIFLFLILSANHADIPKTADIAKIYNIEKASSQKVDVRFYRQGQCNEDRWCNINGEGEYLKASDKLLTGGVSRADLALMFGAKQYNEVLFWQKEGSLSKFEPKEGTCHFRVESGGFLYAHPHQSVNPGCTKISSKSADVFPNGTALFIETDDKETMVGALSNKPGGLIKVQHLKSNETAQIRPGEYAKTLPNGKIIKGLFSLDDFYRTNPLGLGLGPNEEDEDYVGQQEPAIQVILRKLRPETLAAVDEQKKMIAEKKIDINLPGATGNGDDDPVNPSSSQAGSATQTPMDTTGQTNGGTILTDSATGSVSPSNNTSSVPNTEPAPQPSSIPSGDAGASAASGGFNTAINPSQLRNNPTFVAPPTPPTSSEPR